MTTASPALEPDACYLALRTRDARFDGRFFTGVTSTGIYCRPVCAVRTPRRENCRFFRHAAQAEGAGFRPCLRCRPELAPHAEAWSIQDGGGVLARQAVRLIDDPGAWPDDGPTVEWLAARLGVSDRHLRRLFEAELGTTPMQYLQTRRLLTAKQLLTDTRLPVHQVALASGYGSVRRFNAAFSAHYGLRPLQLRGGERAPGPPAALRLRHREPCDREGLLGFFRQRAIAGVEQVDGLALRRTLALEAGGRTFSGWVAVRFDPRAPQVEVQVADALWPVLPRVVQRVRALLDLDADAEAIEATLGAAFPGGGGLRVPGTLDGFELAVRAILGQQITVAAARTLGQRLADRYGPPLVTPWPGLDRLFPGAAALAAVPADELGALGIVRQRQRAILALAGAVAARQIDLEPGADVPGTIAALKALPGIGDWTAQYIAMRALRWPDAFPAGDVALHTALGVRGQPQPARAAEALSAAWRPWRSYAVIRAWSGLAAAGPEASTGDDHHA